MIATSQIFLSINAASSRARSSLFSSRRANAALNYVKRKGREQKAYQKVLYEDHRVQTSGETELLRDETIEKAKAALAQLPENLREVLILREYADMNYKEIGKTLGITEGNVKVRVFRAREQLSKLIGEDDVYLS